MEQEIKDIISKNLPEQVGSVLKTRLEKAEKDAQYISELEEKLAEKDEKVKTLYKKVSELEQNNIDKKQLDAFKEELDTKARELELEITKIKLDEAIKRSEAVYHLTEQVFRSPVTRKRIENMTYGGYNQNGQSVTNGAVPTHITETIE